MSGSVVKLKINQQVVEAQAGMTVLECARTHGIFIPSLCNLEGLPTFASCRLCLVEIKGRPHRSPACQTEVEEGMEVITTSPELEKLRRSIFELILSEHPYFCLFCQEKGSCEELKVTMVKALEPGGCLFCPKDGNCELQQVADYLRLKSIPYEFEDRGLSLWQSDPFLKHNPNLCILCGRCVRVCSEIRGEGVLSFIRRGSRTAIGTFMERSLREADCSFCGACLDVCPTAAFSERGVVSIQGKKIYEKSFICPLCGCGCELKAEILEDGSLRRITSAAAGQEAFNSGCYRGRFGLKELLVEKGADSQPAVKKDGQVQAVSWSEAIVSSAGSLKKYKPEEIALVLGWQNSVESQLAFLEFGQILGIKNLFYFYPGAFLEKIAFFEKENGIKLDRGLKLQELSQAKTLVLVDSDLKAEALTVWLEVRKKLRRGAGLIVLDPGLNRSGLTADLSLRCEPGKESQALLAILKQIIKKATSLSFYHGYDRLLDDLGKISEEQLTQECGLKNQEIERAAQVLLENQPVAFIFGERLLRQPGWQQNLKALWNLDLRLEGRLFLLTSRINELLPENLKTHYGLKIISSLDQLEKDIRESKIKALYLLGDLPLNESPEFLIIQNQFPTQVGKEADVFLPEANCLEQSGSLFDLEGKIRISRPLEKFSSGKLEGQEILKRLGEQFGINLRADWSEILFKVLSEGAKERGSGEMNYLPLTSGAAEKAPIKETVKRKDPWEFNLIVGQNLDFYAGVNMAEVVSGFKLINNPHWLWLNPREASELGLKKGQKVIVETELGELPLEVKFGPGMKPGTALVNPILDEPFKVQLYNLGITKGIIRVKK